eukprot:150479-Ditylum_brightwellii.AAC.1
MAQDFNQEKHTAYNKEIALMTENTCCLGAQQYNYTLWHAGHIASTAFPLLPSLPVQPKYSYATTWLLCREGVGPGPPSKMASVCCAPPYDPAFVSHKLLPLCTPTPLLQ